MPGRPRKGGTAEPAVGITFPLNSGGALTPAELRDWIAAVTEAGFDYVSIGDHLLGMSEGALSQASRERWVSAYPGALGSVYGAEDIFREPLMLGAFFAGMGTRLGIATGVVAVPQRQTVLFAKQAAELDHYCEGRLRLGVGAGWNPIEFEALGAKFRGRQEVIEEQLLLLRRLWTEDVVTFEGEFHSIEASGIQLLPVQRPIPLWLGGDGPRTLDRVGRVADGWHPAGRVQPGARARECLGVIHEAARRAGRDPAEIGLEVRVFTAGRPPGEIRDEVRAWAEHKPTMLCADAGTRHEPNTLETHVPALRRAAEILRCS